MSRVTGFFTSIQTRLLAVFLINTLLTVAIVFVFNQWLRNQLIAEADNALLVSAVQIADRIDEFNRSNRQVFNVGSRLPDLVEFLQADETQRGDIEFQERTRITLDSLEIEPWDEFGILSQAILDRNGNNILDTVAQNIGTNEGEEAYFRAALLGGSIYISAIQYRPERSGIYFYYAVPLREETPPTSVIGVLRVQIAVATVQDIVFESVRGQDLNVALFDENYVRVMDTQHEDLLFRSITSFSPEQIATLRAQYALPPLPDQEVSVPVPALADALANTHQNRVVSGYTRPHADREERLAIVRLQTVPWHLVVTQPASQYYEPIQQQTTGILVLTITLTIIALISSSLIAQRIIEPIRALTAMAQQVAEGTLHTKAPVTSSDEVGSLTKTFNLMTTELENARAMLEERVKQRTQELSKANQKLQHEIAERQRYEKQALELALEHERRRILSEFIRKASHEFRTPLSIINTKSYVVQRLLPDENQQHLKVIEEQSKYIEGLVNRMVLMSRLDSGVTIPAEDLQIDELIRTIYASKTKTFREQQAVTHLDLQAAGTWVNADPELLSLAMQNILDNALKYADKPLEISIKTCTAQDTVAIIIEDNGRGIPEDLQPRVFERFFRVDQAHTTRGFGLGLPLAKRIVEHLGGTIALDSEEGKGTTVTLKLDIKTTSKVEPPI